MICSSSKNKMPCIRSITQFGARALQNTLLSASKSKEQAREDGDIDRLYPIVTFDLMVILGVSTYYLNNPDLPVSGTTKSPEFPPGFRVETIWGHRCLHNPSFQGLLCKGYTKKGGFGFPAVSDMQGPLTVGCKSKSEPTKLGILVIYVHIYVAPRDLKCQMCPMQLDSPQKTHRHRQHVGILESFPAIL